MQLVALSQCSLFRRTIGDGKLRLEDISSIFSPQGSTNRKENQQQHTRDNNNNMKTSPRQRSRKLIALLLTLAILAMVLLASSAITPSYAAEPMALDDNVPDIFPSYDDNDDIDDDNYDSRWLFVNNGTDPEPSPSPVPSESSGGGKKIFKSRTTAGLWIGLIGGAVLSLSLSCIFILIAVQMMRYHRAQMYARMQEPSRYHSPLEAAAAREEED